MMQDIVNETEDAIEVEELLTAEEIEQKIRELTVPPPRITELEEAPPALKELVLEMSKNITTIKGIVFGANIVEMKGAVGRYYTEAKCIVIDMGSALLRTNLYNKGMMFIPNVWFELIHAIAHEVEHATQLEMEPDIEKYEILSQEYEDFANNCGNEAMIYWAENNQVPELKDMGWLGKQLVMLLNAAYTKAPDIGDDVEYVRAGAAAKVEDVFAVIDVDDPELRQRTMDDIDKGAIGLKVNDKRFLTASEFLGMI